MTSAPYYPLRRRLTPKRFIDVKVYRIPRCSQALLHGDRESAFLSFPSSRSVLHSIEDSLKALLKEAPESGRRTKIMTADGIGPKGPLES